MELQLKGKSRVPGVDTVDAGPIVVMYTLFFRHLFHISDKNSEELRRFTSEDSTVPAYLKSWARYSLSGGVCFREW